MTGALRNDGLWEYEDVAEYLGVSPKTVRKWANERRLPVVKVGARRQRRLNQDAVDLGLFEPLPVPADKTVYS